MTQTKIRTCRELQKCPAPSGNLLKQSFGKNRNNQNRKYLAKEATKESISPQQKDCLE